MVELNFKEGIIPVAAQDNETSEVLMIAFMNKDAFELTRKTGYVHYWSRKNRRVWKKGEVSGHFQRVKGILVDCDSDALVIKVDQVQAACHMGFRSCFFRTIDGTTIGKKVFDPEAVYKTGDNAAESRPQSSQKYRRRLEDVQERGKRLEADFCAQARRNQLCQRACF